MCKKIFADIFLSLQTKLESYKRKVPKSRLWNESIIYMKGAFFFWAWCIQNLFLHSFVFSIFSEKTYDLFKNLAVNADPINIFSWYKQSSSSNLILLFSSSSTVVRINNVNMHIYIYIYIYIYCNVLGTPYKEQTNFHYFISKRQHSYTTII